MTYPQGYPPQPQERADAFHGPPPPYQGPLQDSGPYPQPYPPAVPPPPRVGRRKLLLGAAAGGGVLLAGGVTGVVALTSRQRHAADNSSGTDNYDANSLPTAAGGGAGITADVQALLDKHNAALKARDESAFLSAFEPGSGAAANAKVLFANLSQIPFDSAEYRLIGQASRVFSGGGASSTTQVDVAFVHQISGVDVKPVPEWYRWTLVRKGGAGSPLSITQVTGSPAIAGSARWVFYPAPWDLGPLTVTRHGNVILAGLRGRDGDLIASVAAVAAQAATDNLSGWRGPAGVSQGLFVMGTSNRDTFYALYSGMANQHGHEAGFTIPLLAASSVDTVGTDRTFGGARITLDLTTPYFTQNSGANSPLTLLRHEGAHALVAPLLTAIPEPPLWVIEGFAEYMASRFTAPTAELFIPALKQYAAGAGLDTNGKWDGRSLPTDTHVYDSSLTTSDASYALATLAYRFIEQRGGPGAVCEFVARNYQAKGRDDVDAAIHTVLGMDLGSFQSAWAGYVHSTIGI